MVGQFDLLTSKWNDDLNHLELNNGNSKKVGLSFLSIFQCSNPKKNDVKYQQKS